MICDGIAGKPGGDVAARLACETIVGQFNTETHLDAQHIRHYIAAANRAILQTQARDAQLKNMGTTLVSLFIDRDYQLAYWAHAGTAASICSAAAICCSRRAITAWRSRCAMPGMMAAA